MEKTLSAMLLLLAVSISKLCIAQYQTEVAYPSIDASPFAAITGIKGFFNDEETGWQERSNGTNRSDAASQIDLRKLRIHNKNHVMLLVHCSDRANFFVFDSQAFTNAVQLKENKAFCSQIPIKYYGFVRTGKDSLTLERLEAELMNRIAFHDNLGEALERMSYTYCINAYWDQPRRKVKFYHFFQQKSNVDEYISLQNCGYRKSYTKLWLEPEIFNERYLEIDLQEFNKFWKPAP
jgi:hypothetical protein